MSEPTVAVFLPGILMPASARYAPLRSALGDGRPTVTKELEVYATSEPPPDYSVQTEVDGLDRFVDENGFDRFHLYGHSAGGAISIAYTTQHPDRVVSLAVDEPASDFSDEDRATLNDDLPPEITDLPVPERMAFFARSLVREEVELPPPPPPSGDPEMAKRPAGVVAFVAALSGHRLPDGAALAGFRGPIYFSYGSLSNARWEAMAERFAALPRCTVERFEGIHHLNTSHQADPVRVAASLQRVWKDSGAAR